MRARLRAAKANDAETLAALTGQLGYAVTPGEVADRLGRLLEDPASVVLVAVDGADRPLDWVHGQLHRSLESEGSVRVGGLVVDEGLRSQGIGQDLLRAVEQWARERGVARMTLYSRQTRERAHRFYEREGYRVAKRSYMLEKDLA